MCTGPAEPQGLQAGAERRQPPGMRSAHHPGTSGTAGMAARRPGCRPGQSPNLDDTTRVSAVKDAQCRARGDRKDVAA